LPKPNKVSNKSRNSKLKNIKSDNLDQLKALSRYNNENYKPRLNADLPPRPILKVESLEDFIPHSKISPDKKDEL
jgi:hypothetical protein